MRDVARQVCDAHSQQGGASVHLYFGDLEGQALFAVSLYPERTIRINGKDISPDLIIAFCRQNAGLLQDPRLVLGTWYNADEEITYLDVTAVFTMRHEAIALAEAYNQIAVYDLAQEAEIDIGGTGAELPDILPEYQRLPPLMREERRES
jgi:hypothetical protein